MSLMEGHEEWNCSECGESFTAHKDDQAKVAMTTFGKCPACHVKANNIPVKKIGVSIPREENKTTLGLKT